VRLCLLGGNVPGRSFFHLAPPRGGGFLAYQDPRPYTHYGWRQILLLQVIESGSANLMGKAKLVNCQYIGGHR
jgi:hypothetical protein